jgi:hypothetical protein
MIDVMRDDVHYEGGSELLVGFARGKNVNDPKDLTEIMAESFMDRDLNWAALSRRSNINLLETAASHGKIANQAILGSLLINALHDVEERDLAIRYVSDQGLLRKIATNPRDEPSTRKIAVSAITDQEILFDVATTATDYFIAELAINALSDQEKITSLARYAVGVTRLAAISKTDDVGLLSKIKDSTDSALSRVAAKRLLSIEDDKTKDSTGTRELEEVAMVRKVEPVRGSEAYL